MKKSLVIYTVLIFSFFIMPTVLADTTYVHGTITYDPDDKRAVVLRSNPNDDISRVKDHEGNNVSINYPFTFEILGEELTYYKSKVQYYGEYYIGYIPKKYATKLGNYIVKDETFEAMRNLGFDDTYASKLAVLKTIYPEWEFIPYEVNYDYSIVVDRESRPVSNNLISTGNLALVSTEDGSLKPDGTYQKYDNGLYVASKQTIAFYLDPRNFLNDNYIFMFEALQYNERAHHLAIPALNEILRATFMEKKTFACKDGFAICHNNPDAQIPKNFSEIFLEAGNLNKINPIHLATRVYIEQGKGTSSIISGNGYNEEYVGYYNFFNIAASGNKAGTIVSNALKSAYNRGWNSPYASILGGSEFVGKWYIYYDKENLLNNQDTVYFQKFDVVGNNPTFYYQYQQNILAPYSESSIMSTGYKVGDVINLPYKFKIPIYKYMPAETTLSAEGSYDANLKSLNITGCLLMPSFSSSAISYTCAVTKDVTKVTVTAKATSNSATISGLGQVEIPNMENNINIVVTSGNGSVTKTYTVKIKKADLNELTPDDIMSRLQINNNAGALSGFTLGTNGSDFINTIKASYPSVAAQVTKENTLGTGTNIIINNNGSKTYTVLIYGDNNGDGIIDILDLLKVQKHLIGADKLKDLYSTASDVNKDGIIDILDLLLIQKNILGSGQITQ